MSIFDIFRKDNLHIKSVGIFNKGVILYENGNYNDAIKEFLDSLRVLEKANINQSQKNDLIAGIYAVMSRTRVQMRQFDLAEKDLQRALLLRPSDEGLYLSLGFLKLDQNQFDKAIMSFEKIIELNPLDPDGYYYSGVCKHELEKYREAITDFEKTLQLESNLRDDISQSGIFASLGGSYAKLNELDKAIEYYNKAISLDDKNRAAFVNRGNCKIDLGQTKEGCSDYYRALELGDLKVQENIDEYCKKQ